MPWKYLEHDINLVSCVQNAWTNLFNRLKVNILWIFEHNNKVELTSFYTLLALVSFAWYKSLERIGFSSTRLFDMKTNIFVLGDKAVSKQHQCKKYNILLIVTSYWFLKCPSTIYSHNLLNCVVSVITLPKCQDFRVFENLYILSSSCGYSGASFFTDPVQFSLFMSERPRWIQLK